MYKYFNAKVTRIEKEHESTIAAARKSMMKTMRNQFPSGFKFDPDMVSFVGIWRGMQIVRGGGGASLEEKREDGRGGGMRRRR